MLVLTRRHGESVRIGRDIRVTVVASTGAQVRIAIEAPEEVGIFREEIFEQVATANVEAASGGNAMVGPIRVVRSHAKNRMGGSQNG
ncbi:MAG: carbon storage regulator CsrA [Myxococcota bacterium]